MSKQDRYSSKSEIDELDSLTEKLAADLRKSIRNLEHYPILSDPWFEMADVFGRMATISDMESKLSAGKNDSATLWETEEQALRFLLEDGKIMLCLRSLIEFKQAQTEARKRGKGPMIDFSAECDKFEKGLGSIFRNAWQHVEVLQTTDLPALITHIADTLQAALEMPEVMEALGAAGDLHQRQEVLVFYYLLDLMRHMEEIGESRIMPLVKTKRLFLLACRVLCKYSNKLLPAHRLKACEALSALVETEHYATYADSYVDLANATGEVDVLCELKDTVLADLMKDLTQRKLVRPLNDAIDKCKRLRKSGEGSRK